jgi:hypothetical protein
MLSKTFTAALFVTTAIAAVISQPNSLFTRKTGESAAAMLLEIAPTSNSCDNAPAPGECATAEEAAGWLISAMENYGIFSRPELAALLSLIAFETADFKYNINHYPGRAGQGTRNMQMAQYNLEYALSIPALEPQVKAITTAISTAGLTDSQLNAIRALVLPDQYSWASAAWFLTAKCMNIRAQLTTGGQDGWTAYLGCVGTTPTPERLAYWTRANAALSVSM